MLALLLARPASAMAPAKAPSPALAGRAAAAPAAVSAARLNPTLATLPAAADSTQPESPVPPEAAPAAAPAPIPAEGGDAAAQAQQTVETTVQSWTAPAPEAPVPPSAPNFRNIDRIAAGRLRPGAASTRRAPSGEAERVRSEAALKRARKALSSKNGYDAALAGIEELAPILHGLPATLQERLRAAQSALIDAKLGPDAGPGPMRELLATASASPTFPALETMATALSALDSALANTPLLLIRARVLELAHDREVASRLEATSALAALAARAEALTAAELAQADALLAKVWPRRDAKAKRRVVFVCTGNSDRSPMAERLFKKMTADEPGLEIVSRGVSAFRDSISSEAMRALSKLGADGRGHVPTKLDGRDVESADVIVAMTYGHVAEIRREFPEAAGKLLLLHEYAGDGSLDVADPVTVVAERQKAESPDGAEKPLNQAEVDAEFDKKAAEIRDALAPVARSERALLALRDAVARAKRRGPLPAIPEAAPADPAALEQARATAAELYRVLARDSGIERRLRDALAAIAAMRRAAGEGF